jgi:dihydrofolate reductase
MRLIAIVAMSSNRVIGREGKLPWHFPRGLEVL